MPLERAVHPPTLSVQGFQYVPGDQADGKKPGRKPDQKKKKSRPKPEAEGKEEDDESGYRYRASVNSIPDCTHRYRTAEC